MRDLGTSSHTSLSCYSSSNKDDRSFTHLVSERKMEECQHLVSPQPEQSYRKFFSHLILEFKALLPQQEPKVL